MLIFDRAHPKIIEIAFSFPECAYTSMQKISLFHQFIFEIQSILIDFALCGNNCTKRQLIFLVPNVQCDENNKKNKTRPPINLHTFIGGFILLFFLLFLSPLRNGNYAELCWIK